MLTDRERRALAWSRETYTAPPLPAPRIRLPKGLLSWALIIALFPIAVPLLVMGQTTHKALTKRTNRY